MREAPRKGELTGVPALARYGAPPTLGETVRPRASTPFILRVVGCALTAVLAACGVLRGAVAHSAGEAERPSFDAQAIARGAQLAAIGNCNVCHTAPEGKPYAGGLGLRSHFGTVYSTNITPDAGTGIGRWTQQDFNRAMREGVDPRGRHLYPAFPYDHFTLVTDEDLAAIYAYVMTREPVRAQAPKNELLFPLNLRLSVAAWKAMFFRPAAFRPDPAQSAEWNRGAYLVEGLGHCGACHTPRNMLGAEKRAERHAGGEVEGWHAPALNASSPAPLPWTPERLVAYLRTGVDDVHGAAAGPMVPVVHNLAQVPEQDVRAIAVYVASLDSRPAEEREKRAAAAAARRSAAAQASRNEPGAETYAGACAGCHGATRREHGALQLSLSTSVALPVPDNLIRIIREGIVPPEGAQGPWMPGFAGALTEQQTADLVRYLRRRFSDEPAWKDVPAKVKNIAQGADR
jgi:mono/diheme cytochrome c family protein